MTGDDQYNETETVKRREAALKRMLTTPHRPHKEKRETAKAIPRKGKKA